MATVCVDRYGRRYYCRSGWSNWGRWVVLGVILLVAFLFFFICACLSQRRRKKAGRQPFYGTGWTQRVPGGQGQYNPNQQNKQNYQAPPPQYGQQNNNNYNQEGYQGQNQGYFGGQQANFEMQPPQNVYGSGRNDGGYAPPTGPPPNKAY